MAKTKKQIMTRESMKRAIEYDLNQKKRWKRGKNIMKDLTDK